MRKIEKEHGTCWVDYWGDVVKTIYKDGKSFQAFYDPNGKATKIFWYDKNGHLTHLIERFIDYDTDSVTVRDTDYTKSKGLKIFSTERKEEYKVIK